MEERPKNGGFIIARKIFTSELWLYKPASWKVIWIYILGHVSHKTERSFKRGRGFFMFSDPENILGKGITVDMVKSFCQYARESGMITTRRSTKGVWIEVLNYNEYQTLDSYSTTREKSEPLEKGTFLSQNKKTATRINTRETEEIPININDKGEIGKKQTTDQTTNEPPEKHQRNTPIHKYVKNVKNTSKPGGLQGEQWNQLIDGFKDVNPMYLDFYKNTTERKALDDLVDRLGFEKVKATIEHLQEITAQPYAPKITKPSELKRDLGKLVMYFKQEKSKQIKKTNFII